MARTLVIVGEPMTIMANLDSCLFEIDEARGGGADAAEPLRRGRRGHLTLAENWIERILREDMFNIRKQQFLVLLLVMDAENKNRVEFSENLFIRRGNKFIDMRIDRRAVTLRLFNGWTGDQSAEIPSVHIARGIVVGIE